MLDERAYPALTGIIGEVWDRVGFNKIHEKSYISPRASDHIRPGRNLLRFEMLRRGHRKNSKSKKEQARGRQIKL